MPQHTCKVCTKPFLSNWKAALYCSPPCKRAAATTQRIAANGGLTSNGLPSGSVGAMHEMQVCIDLIRRGFYVFRTVSANSPFDLVASRGENFLRIEVTTGYRSTGGLLQHPTKDRDKFDMLAVVEHSGVITYEPELPTGA